GADPKLLTSPAPTAKEPEQREDEPAERAGARGGRRAAAAFGERRLEGRLGGSAGIGAPAHDLRGLRPASRGVLLDGGEAGEAALGRVEQQGLLERKTALRSEEGAPGLVGDRAVVAREREEVEQPHAVDVRG